MKSILVVAVCAISALALHSLTACDDDDAKTPVTDAGVSSSSSGGGNGLDPPRDGGPNCAATEDEDTCAFCCRDSNEAAADKYGQLVRACVCQDGADFCKTACADTLCSATPKVPQEGTPCGNCIATAEATCGETVPDQCAADPACAPLLDCAVASGCADKPTL